MTFLNSFQFSATLDGIEGLEGAGIEYFPLPRGWALKNTQ